MDTPRHSLDQQAVAGQPLIPLLLVDDRPENLVALEALLGEMDLPLAMIKAGSGNEALRLTLKHDFALVLLDVQMPDMDGFETAMLLRANPKTRHIPIIFITAGIHDRMRQFKGYETGAVDFLNKPIEPVALRSKVGVFCTLYAKCRELEQHKLGLERMVQERTANLTALAVQLSEEVQARRQSEQAVHDSEARLRMVIESAAEAFISISASGAIVALNHEAEHLFGLSREEVLGKSFATLVQDEKDSVGAILASGTGLAMSRHVELLARHSSGREFACELSLWQIPNAAPPLFGALVRDITERKQNEEEASAQLCRAMDQIVETEKLASLGGIVASVTHELNTPIGNLVLLASALKERISELSAKALSGQLTRSGLCESAAQCNDASDVLMRSADRARELIESFKNVAVDQTSQRRRQFDLRRAVSDIVMTLGRMARIAKVEIDVQIPAGILMESYPGHLEQIINNLIVNSILHGFDGRAEGRITISARQMGKNIHLIYQDDGKGIAPALHEKVFEPFYSTKFGAGGSGLGMFIVRKLVLGVFAGTVELESEEGQGLLLRFILPAETP